MNWITGKNGLEYTMDKYGVIWIRGSGDTDTKIQHCDDLDGPVPDSIMEQLNTQNEETNK